MARTARVYYPGGVFHVISRCLNREHLISSEEHREHYLELLSDALSHTDARLLAYCLMSSHTHLVVQAGDEPLARLMRPLLSGFAGWLNRRLGRSGPLFADRYRATLVDKDEYLLQLVRYVHNNPVRAGMVERAADSSWSSHRAYIGQAPLAEWLDVGLVLGLLDDDPQRAAGAFDDFIDEGRDEPRRGELSGGRGKGAPKRSAGDALRPSGSILGSAEFVGRVLEQMKQAADQSVPGLEEDIEALRGRQERPTIDELTDAVCATLGLEAQQFTERPQSRRSVHARRLLVWIWARRWRGKQVEVARALDTSSAVVSRWYRSASERASDFDEQAAAVVEALGAAKS